MPIKNLIKMILFPAGYRKKRVMGGALRGMWFVFNLREDTQQWRGIYEQALQQWLQQNTKAGDVCLDIGAANGYFALLMAKLAGRTGSVYTFEPSALNQQIQANFSLNDASALATLKPYDVFVSDKKSDAASTITIDDLVERERLSHVNIVKIDVDGAEVEVLQGMAETLSRFHPHLFIEVHSHDLLTQVEQITKHYGYTMRLQNPPAHEQRPIKFNAFFFSESV